MRARKESDPVDVIQGTFSLYEIFVYALIEPSSTHSYMCITPLVSRGVQIEELEEDILVTNPLGHSVMMKKVYKGCPLRVQGYEFSADLIELPFHEFDVILGMDWLSHHQAMVDYRLKRIILQTIDGDEITVVGEGTGCLSTIISATVARRLIRKGCEAFLAHVVDTRKTSLSLPEIPTICDFSNVFKEELPGLPPEREVRVYIRYYTDFHCSI